MELVDDGFLILFLAWERQNDYCINVILGLILPC